MTQQDLGKGLGTDGADASKSVVYGWEKDQHYPRVDQLMLLCKKLHCSADHLLFGTQAVAISPKFIAAQEAVSKLNEEERLQLLVAAAQPGLPDDAVEERIPITRKRASRSHEVILPEVQPDANEDQRVQKRADARPARGNR